MTSKQALENIRNAVEYITRLDYVEPIVRGEVKQILFDAYHKTTPEFNIIERDLEILDIIKNKQVDIKDIIDVEGDFEFYHSYCIGKGYANEYICNKEEFKKINRWLDNGK